MNRRPLRSTLLLEAGLLAVLWPTASPAQDRDLGNPNRFEPPVAEDLNPNPDVVEVQLTARAARYDFGTGNRTKVYTFDGTIPGPTIKAKVGNRVLVHFTNRLPEDSTIHWHGVEVPAVMDGSHISQTPVPPGGYFRYDFFVRTPALFWYHPHMRSNEQVEKGLYGLLLVEDPATDAALGLPPLSHLLALDDVLLDAQGQLEDTWPADPVAYADRQLNGREGNLFLVNGALPRTASVVLPRGVPQRLRLVNSSNSRFMRVSAPGHVLYRIGGDQGLLEHPLTLPPVRSMRDPLDWSRPISNADLDEGLLLTPGERADVVVTPIAAQLDLEWHDFPRGRHKTFPGAGGVLGLGHDFLDGRQPPVRLLTFPTSGTSTDVWTPPRDLRTIPPIDLTGAKQVQSVFGHTLPDAQGNVVFFVQMKNGQPLPWWDVTPADAPSLNVGDVAVWEVHNLTHDWHNFHLHGFRFQLLETQWVDLDTPGNNFKIPAPWLEDKDTIALPPRPGHMQGRSKSITRLAVHIDDTGREGQVEAYGKMRAPYSGGWMFHCHILEHAARGMMSFLQVYDP